MAIPPTSHKPTPAIKIAAQSRYHPQKYTTKKISRCALPTIVEVNENLPEDELYSTSWLPKPLTRNHTYRQLPITKEDSPPSYYEIATEKAALKKFGILMSSVNLSSFSYSRSFCEEIGEELERLDSLENTITLPPSISSFNMSDRRRKQIEARKATLEKKAPSTSTNPSSNAAIKDNLTTPT